MFNILSVLFQNAYSQVADLFNNVCIDLGGLRNERAHGRKAWRNQIPHCVSTQYVPISTINYDAISACLAPLAANLLGHRTKLPGLLTVLHPSVIN